MKLLFRCCTRTEDTNTVYSSKVSRLRETRFSSRVFSPTEICVICLDKKVNTLIADCGHRILCDVCVREYIRRTSVCPYCRVEICLIKQDSA